jgi:hypothetical protein
MTAKYWLKPCFGYSANKRGQVGERHRWSGDAYGEGWGRGRCIWCHRDLDELRYPAEVTPREGSELHLAQALRTAA